MGLALLLIAVSAWTFLPYINYRISASAFVNAELARVAAPIAGRLNQALPHKGDFIERSRALNLIESRSVDRRHLHDLERQFMLAGEQATLARKQLEEIAGADSELQSRMNTYRESMIKRLGNEIAEVEAEKAGCLVEARRRQEMGSRWEQLVIDGTASQMRLTEAQVAQEATSTRCAMAEARGQRLKGELISAQQGIFLRDGANDVPYSQQQRDRLLLRRQELETHVLEGSARASKLATDIAEERGRLDRLGHADLPQGHVVWSMAASPGSAVTEGQILLDLADCMHRFVAVELPERDFERIRAGDPAYVRLIGSDDWRTGEVRQVRGSAARTDDRLLAAQIPVPIAGSITVEVGLPIDPAVDRSSFCDIGRLAEVRFERVRSEFVEQFLTRFGWNRNPLGLRTSAKTDD
ncbi:MAG TPA: HlyD family efflux transporter periplasmic adaptor subunit [Xanthobacteraceae bacterium]|nr:HlyD family efflux transporter periplasmic adaptor subunit [Xanthobacteraceae bacterium]